MSSAKTSSKKTTNITYITILHGGIIKQNTNIIDIGETHPETDQIYGRYVKYYGDEITGSYYKSSKSITEVCEELEEKIGDLRITGSDIVFSGSFKDNCKILLDISGAKKSAGKLKKADETTLKAVAEENKEDDEETKQSKESKNKSKSAKKEPKKKALLTEELVESDEDEDKEEVEEPKTKSKSKMKEAKTKEAKTKEVKKETKPKQTKGKSVSVSDNSENSEEDNKPKSNKTVINLSSDEEESEEEN